MMKLQVQLSMDGVRLDGNRAMLTGIRDAISDLLIRGDSSGRNLTCAFLRPEYGDPSAFDLALFLVEDDGHDCE